MASPPLPPDDDRGGTSALLKASSAAGVAGAFVLAVLVNVIVARNYKRIDITQSKLYTLSEPTRQTLRGLGQSVQLNVLLSSGDPLLVSLRHLLEAYHAETDKLDVRYIDPDRKPAEFMAFKEKYGLLAGRTQDGRVVADATIVVVSGDRRWFLTPSDLVDVSEADEGRSKPRLEQGITIAIRNVITGERAQVCFSKGHGELGANEPGARGLGELKHRLERNNVDVQSVDPTAPDSKKQPWQGCTVVIVAGPQQPWSERDATALKDYFEGGGNLLVFASPLFDSDRKRVQKLGLDAVLAAGGVEVRGDLVFEKAKAMVPPGGMGESFIAQAKPHAITQALVSAQQASPSSSKVLIMLGQSLGKISSSAVQPSELLVTSDQAFGMADFFSWTDEMGIPDKRPGDHAGPLALAMASELPKKSPTDPHGPRMVVVGTSAVTQGQVWQQEGLRGGAYFVESAISWLTARPQIVDIPSKPSMMAGMRLSEESISQIANYVTFYIPLSAVLVGGAVYLRRRSTEKRRDGVGRTKVGRG